MRRRSGAPPHPNRLLLGLHPGELLEQLAPWAVGRHESLYPLAGKHFARVEIALRVGGFHMNAEEAATVLPCWPSVPTTLPVLRSRNQILLFVRSEI